MVVLLALLIAVVLGSYLYFRGKSNKNRQLASQAKTAGPRTPESDNQLAAATSKSKSESKIAEARVEPVAAESDVVALDSDSEGAKVAHGSDAEGALQQPPTLIHDVDGIRRGLDKSRRPEGFFGRIAALLSGRKEINADIAAQVEEVLLTSDVGVQTTQVITDRIRDTLTRQQLSDPNVVWDSLRDEARKILCASGRSNAIALRAKPTVILLVGVNGAGKTTTIGKLATRYKSRGHTVLLAAGDTFRAAAVQQLRIWGDRIGVDVVHGKDGADPGSVIFEAVRKAQGNGYRGSSCGHGRATSHKGEFDGRTEEGVKTTAKAMQGAPHEVLLVVDATNGRNAVAQAKEFCQELPVSGMVLTKLDGTAKGGFVVGIAAALQLPVKLIGLGEKATDLHDFDAEDFVEALLGAGPEGTLV